MGEVNFEFEKDLVSNIVERFSVGPKATQVAVISYSGIAVIDFHLNSFTTQETIQTAVENVEYSNIPGILIIATS